MLPGLNRRSSGKGLLLLYLQIGYAAAALLPARYLIISNAANASIDYVRLPRGSVATTNSVPIPLINASNGLLNPQGIAVDQVRGRLFVADPDRAQVLYYRLSANSRELTLVDSVPTVAAEAAARWVAVDGQGNLFLTSEIDSKVLQITFHQIKYGDTSPSVLYSSATGDFLSSPGGIATDNFQLYWSNKVEGQNVGVLVKAPVYEGASSTQTAMALNIDKSYGVCIANNNVYYTAEVNDVYVVKRDGGLTTLVGNNFSSPRGCVWDGDHTVYVADRTQNAVFSFSGPMLHPVEGRVITRAIEAPGAFGLAVFRSISNLGRTLLPSVGSWMMLMLTLMLSSFAASSSSLC